jgi:hypothetical protein
LVERAGAPKAAVCVGAFLFDRAYWLRTAR